MKRLIPKLTANASGGERIAIRLDHRVLVLLPPRSRCVLVVDRRQLDDVLHGLPELLEVFQGLLQLVAFGQ